MARASELGEAGRGRRRSEWAQPSASLRSSQQGCDSEQEQKRRIGRGLPNMNSQPGRSHAQNDSLSYQFHCISDPTQALPEFGTLDAQSSTDVRGTEEVRESRGYPEPNLTPAVPRASFHGSGFLSGLAPGRCYRRRECPRSTPNNVNVNGILDSRTSDGEGVSLPSCPPPRDAAR